MSTRQRRLGLLAAALAAPVFLASLALPQAQVGASPAAAPTTGELHRFDATRREGSCLAVGTGLASGEATVDFSLATNTVHYRLTLAGAVPNAEYALEVAECSADGLRLARGDAGRLRTDARGDGSLEGDWAALSAAPLVRLTLLRVCAAPGDDEPRIPCDSTGYATDALLPAGR